MKKALVLALVLVMAVVSGGFRADARASNCEVYFARVVAAETPIYKVEAGEYVEFAPLRNPIYKGSVQRLCDVGDGWAQLIDDPDPTSDRDYSPWRSFDGVDRAYIRTDGLSVVRDLSAINVCDGTVPGEKLILVNMNRKVVALVEERCGVVLQSLAGMGKSVEGVSKTLYGFGHLCTGYTTTTMGDYAGVPYPLYICMVNQEFTGQALHGAYWYNWDNLNQGYWGSAGCVNLPVRSKFDVVWQGERVPIDEFVYRWSKTNLQFDPYTEEGYMVSSYEGLDWYRGEETVRVIVVYDWWELDYYPNSDNVYRQWQPLIDELESLDGLVRLPDTDAEGVLTFRQKPASQLP